MYEEDFVLVYSVKTRGLMFLRTDRACEVDKYFIVNISFFRPLGLFHANEQKPLFE